MKTSRLTRQVIALTGASIVLVIATFVALTLTINSLERATQEARVHERVATGAARVGALVVDAETAVRGYVLTGQEPFIGPLLNTQRELPGVTERLRADARNATERRIAESVSSSATAYVWNYAQPTIDKARNDRASAQDVITSQSGKRRVDEIRSQVGDLVQAADRAAQSRQEAAERRGDIARIVAVLAGLALLGVVLFFIRAVQRRVVSPVLEATDAAARIGSGDLAVRLPVLRDDEIGKLAHGLNTMAAHLHDNAVELEAQHTELESQNAELEAQSVELETQTVELERSRAELSTANDSLQARQEELERTAAQLAISSERMRLYAHVAESLAEVPDVETRAKRLLAEIADVTGAPIGTVYATTAKSRGACVLVARRGLASAPESVADAGDLVERTLSERRPVTASHPDTSLELTTLGSRVAVRHEAHLPLLAGPGRSEVLGVVSLGRTDDRAFGADDLEMLRHLVDSAALAFYNALVSASRERQAALMRAVLNSVSEAILVVTTTGEVVLSNPPMEDFARQLTGLGADEPWTIPQLQEAMDAEVRDLEARAANLERLRKDPMATDREVIELPSHNQWIHRYAAPVHGFDDELLGRIVVVRDITEERQAERTKDDLMSTVSHELRTPLAAILGFTELLVTREFPEAERKEYLDTVYQQSVRLSELLDDFLDLQRIERRGLDRSAPIDLREVIEDEVKLYTAQSSAHQLAASLAPHPLVVDGDAERLHRVVGNLLSNAIKYSPSGGPVRVEAGADDGHVRVSVVDRGVGIPEDARQKIFDRFFRVDSRATARIGGTGLGLALVRDIVAAHGGEVGVDSVEGEGSRFWFTLPRSE